MIKNSHEEKTRPHSLKYFLDTEFIEQPYTIQLISIGIVCEDGREYYAISSEFDESLANDWVKEHVISRLEPIERKPLKQIKQEILDFVIDKKPEFWGYYADYDWVAFCWIFGRMVDLPKHFPMYCRDIKQLADELLNPRMSSFQKNEHNALSDAKWNQEYYDFLIARLKEFTED